MSCCTGTHLSTSPCACFDVSVLHTGFIAPRINLVSGVDSAFFWAILMAGKVGEFVILGQATYLFLGMLSSLNWYFLTRSQLNLHPKTCSD